jgi:hypothetical protein
MLRGRASRAPSALLEATPHSERRRPLLAVYVNITPAWPMPRRVIRAWLGSARNAELNRIRQPERGRDGEVRTACRKNRHLALHHLTAGQDYRRCDVALFSNLATAFHTAVGHRGGVELWQARA